MKFFTRLASKITSLTCKAEQRSLISLLIFQKALNLPPDRLWLREQPSWARASDDPASEARSSGPQASWHRRWRHRRIHHSAVRKLQTTSGRLTIAFSVSLSLFLKIGIYLILCFSLSLFLNLCSSLILCFLSLLFSFSVSQSLSHSNSRSLCPTLSPPISFSVFLS